MLKMLLTLSITTDGQNDGWWMSAIEKALFWIVHCNSGDRKMFSNSVNLFPFLDRLHWRSFFRSFFGLQFAAHVITVIFSRAHLFRRSGSEIGDDRPIDPSVCWSQRSNHYSRWLHWTCDSTSETNHRCRVVRFRFHRSLQICLPSRSETAGRVRSHSFRNGDRRRQCDLSRRSRLSRIHSKQPALHLDLLRSDTGIRWKDTWRCRSVRTQLDFGRHSVTLLFKIKRNESTELLVRKVIWRALSIRLKGTGETVCTFFRTLLPIKDKDERKRKGQAQAAYCQCFIIQHRYRSKKRRFHTPIQNKTQGSIHFSFLPLELRHTGKIVFHHSGKLKCDFLKK